MRRPVPEVERARRAELERIAASIREACIEAGARIAVDRTFRRHALTVELGASVLRLERQAPIDDGVLQFTRAKELADV
mgnify:CR=1 FL=1